MDEWSVMNGRYVYLFIYISCSYQIEIDILPGKKKTITFCPLESGKTMIT